MFSAGVMELVAIMIILAPIALLVGAILFLAARRKKH